MSENTINAALRYMGFDKETMTGHRFRAMASTCLNEMAWAPDVIERQLAHVERNKVRASYNRAQYLTERVRVMTAWANYLDGLVTDEGYINPAARVDKGSFSVMHRDSCGVAMALAALDRQHCSIH